MLSKKLILLLNKSTSTNVGSWKTFNTWQPSIRLCLLLLSSLYLVVYLYPLPFQGLYMWPWYAVLQKISFVLLFTHHTYTLIMILEWLFRIVITRPTHMVLKKDLCTKIRVSICESQIANFKPKLLLFKVHPNLDLVNKPVRSLLFTKSRGLI